MVDNDETAGMKLVSDPTHAWMPSTEPVLRPSQPILDVEVTKNMTARLNTAPQTLTVPLNPWL